MAKRVDPDQTAPTGAVCSGSTLFASILNSQLFAADDFSRRHFTDAFFLGALRVNAVFYLIRSQAVKKILKPKVSFIFTSSPVKQVKSLMTGSRFLFPVSLQLLAASS